MGVEPKKPEGTTPIDLDEVADLIPSLSNQEELNEFEILNISEAVAWAERSKMVVQKILLPETQRRLHREMFGKTWKWAGQFRRTQKSIGVEAYRIGIELKHLSDDAEFWIKANTYPPEEIAARFHHRLVWIHPFPNGNGRFARLATDLLCRKMNWPISNWGRSNLVVASSIRERYIQALRSADVHEFQPLVRFMFPSADQNA